MTTSPAADERPAYLAGIACYSLWGILPLYFHLLAMLGVGSFEMIAHRTLWSAPWAAALVLAARQGGEVAQALRRPKTLGILALSTLAILCNWTIYVVAVNSGHVIEASLGYYINPLMNMAAGALLFRERMSRGGRIAVGLAAIGVAIQTAALGRAPMISLGLATTFTIYAILRKRVKADAQTGLFIECAYLAIPGLLYVLHLQASGAGHFGAGAAVTTLLMLAGPATVVPLALFAWSARRLPLSAVGFLQFISPTLQFALGVAFGEPFTQMRALSFAFIWLGVAAFAFGALRRTRPLPAV
ncbi:MAG: EamA family transporter RarD [Methylocella sp.]